MDRLETLLAQIKMFDAPMRAFLLERATAMSPAAREEFIATLASYTEERDQLQTEFNEHSRLLDDELRSELGRIGGAVHSLEKELTTFAQSLEQDPEDLIAS